MRDDLFSAYLQYTSNNETPAVFHRWAAISAIGALLGRNFSVEFGHQLLAPNIYCMLMGSPGSRKSTAIKSMKKLIVGIGYDTIAADKTTKEKFMLDMAGHSDTEGSSSIEEFSAKNAGVDSSAQEIFIMADEFNDFFGNNILDFVSFLGNLWDYEGLYKNRIKNGQSIIIHNPTVSILGGNTPTQLAATFPPEVIGQGFFSRLIMVYGEPTRPKVSFPIPPDPDDTLTIQQLLGDVRLLCIGNCKLEPAAYKLADQIYMHWKGIPDTRFEYYGNRRFTQLLKLCAIHAAARIVMNRERSNVITVEDVICANTVLTVAEHEMPKALGEFGKSKNSNVVHTILELLNKATKPIPFQDLFKAVSRDVGAIREFAPLIQSLQVANKIQHVNDGYLPVKAAPVPYFMEAINWDYLLDEEKRYVATGTT